jgi:hypothetical protein
MTSSEEPLRYIPISGYALQVPVVVFLLCHLATDRIPQRSVSAVGEDSVLLHNSQTGSETNQSAIKPLPVNFS